MNESTRVVSRSSGASSEPPEVTHPPVCPDPIASSYGLFSLRRDRTTVAITVSTSCAGFARGAPGCARMAFR